MAGEAKSYTRTVSSGQERLAVMAVAAKGDWSFHILHKDEDGNKMRGASARYPSFDAAKAAVDGAVAMAVKIGWQEKEPSHRVRNLARNIREPRIYDPKLGR
jgi:hypothetical protein